MYKSPTVFHHNLIANYQKNEHFSAIYNIIIRIPTANCTRLCNIRVSQPEAPTTINYYAFLNWNILNYSKNIIDNCSIIFR